MHLADPTVSMYVVLHFRRFLVECTGEKRRGECEMEKHLNLFERHLKLKVPELLKLA